MIFNNIRLNERTLMILSLLMIGFVNLPYLLLGSDFFVPFGYDSLDSNVVWNKILTESGKLFSCNSTIIEPAMGGLPRGVYGRELSIGILFYVLFNPVTAYIFNIILIQLIAFAGTVLLLKTLCKNPDPALWLIYSIAFIFSCLKFWPHAGISVAGLPLFIYGYSISKDRLLQSIIISLVYVLYSSLVLTGIFLLALLMVDQLVKLIKHRFNLNQFIIICITGLFYLITEYRLVLTTLDPLFVSHRTDFVIKTFGIKESLSTFFKMVFTEYGHNLKHALFIMLITLSWISYCLIKKIRIESLILCLLSLIILLSAISVLFQSTFFYSLYSKIEFLKLIQLQRFYWLLPPLYYVLLFLVLYEILKKTNKRLLVSGILIIQFLIVFHVNTNWRQVIKTHILGRNTEILTFNQFYSQRLYKEIKDYIGKDQKRYRVASLGLHPAVALYNGFYTIDGYISNYPKKYKDEFYLIMKDELSKNKTAEDFFLNFGSVCVILSDEMIQKYNGKGFVVPAFSKSPDNVIYNLQIDTDQMLKMNAEYLFSAFRIENAETINLKPEGFFEETNSPWGVYLYSVNRAE